MKTAQRYKAVNGAWPSTSLPALTAQEAISAFRILYRHRFDKKWDGEVRAVKGRHRRTWAGGSYVKRINGVLTRVKFFNVAPDQGWHNFIHDLSHWMHRQQYPGQNPHKGSNHAAVEIDLIEQVVNRGWLEGKLKRKPRAKKPKLSLQETRYQRVMKSIKAWETKKKRADNALKKLHQKRRYYQARLYGNNDHRSSEVEERARISLSAEDANMLNSYLPSGMYELSEETETAGSA